MKNNAPLAFRVNCAIFGLTLAGIAVLIYDVYQLNHSVLEVLSAIKYYTVESNILMAIIALIYAFYIKSGKPPTYPLSLVKLIGTVGVALTFLTVVFYLAPISGPDFLLMFTRYNFFLHLTVPVLSIFSFIFLEDHTVLPFKSTLLGIVTMLVYGVFYMINVIAHFKDGKVSTDYDWYCFVQYGAKSIFIVIAMMIVGTYLISFVLWKFNQLKHHKKSASTD